MTVGRRNVLTTLRKAADLYGDVLTAYVDVSRTSEDGAREVEMRMDNIRRDVGEQVGDPLLERLASRLQEPTGHGGELSRVVVGHGDDLVTDLLIGRAVTSRHHVGPIAHSLELARDLADAVSYVLVRIDHKGADITVADSLRPAEVDLVSEGDDDVITKVAGGGWSHRRFQARAEDSWDRNADTVARDLEGIVKEWSPDLVLVTGDPYGCSRLTEVVAGHVSERLEVLEHGSRAEGASDERMEEDVAAAVQRCRSGRISQVLDSIGAADSPTAVGVGETLESLRRGEVETLVLLDGALDGREAWVGPEPLLLGHTADELRALSVDDPAQDRLDEAMLRAALGQDADLLPLWAPVSALPDGVGAVLRFDSRAG